MIRQFSVHRVRLFCTWKQHNYQSLRPGLELEMRRRLRIEKHLLSSLVLLLLLFSSPTCSSSDADFAALVDFKREIASDPDGLLSDWENLDPCSWTGIFCNARGRVVEISISGESDRDIRGLGLQGKISAAIGRLTELRVLSLPFNGFSGEFPVQIWDIPSLEVVKLDGNFISGALPSRFPPRLRVLNLAFNLIQGEIPLFLFRCSNLEILDLSHNGIEGAIPNLFVELPRLKILDLSFNRIGGYIPSEIGAGCPSLEYFKLSSNHLIGALPAEIHKMEKLQILNLSRNGLSGTLPRCLSQHKSLRFLDISRNQFSGEIPEDLGLLSSLTVLDLSWNKLQGQIPASFGRMKNLKYLFLAGNNFNSQIPSEFLHLLDISSNSVSPKNTSPRRHSFLETSKSAQFTSIEIAAVASATIIVAILITLIGIYVFMRKCLPRNAVRSSERREVILFMGTQVPLTYEIVVRATGNFTGSNCIGNGGFGATYKAEVSPGIIYAIKRLSIGKVQAIQHFQTEIKALGTCRHPNLVTLIGYHLSEGETFLIYNYLPGGNLEKFIRERSKNNVDFWVLHKIALDVARALKYLHHKTVRIIHRDVKPSNILLDDGFKAYLSDFGLARLLSSSETHLTTGVEGTFGYVAPEYLTQGRVSEKADVYSYGVLLLELISDKKVLDPSFCNYGHGFNIVSWARMLITQGKQKEFFAPEIWDGGPHDDLVETLNLAVACTDALPSARPTMKVVVERLKQLHSPPLV